MTNQESPSSSGDLRTNWGRGAAEAWSSHSWPGGDNKYYDDDLIVMMIIIIMIIVMMTSIVILMMMSCFSKMFFRTKNIQVQYTKHIMRMKMFVIDHLGIESLQ